MNHMEIHLYTYKAMQYGGSEHEPLNWLNLCPNSSSVADFPVELVSKHL